MEYIPLGDRMIIDLIHNPVTYSPLLNDMQAAEPFSCGVITFKGDHIEGFELGQIVYFAPRTGTFMPVKAGEQMRMLVQGQSIVATLDTKGKDPVLHPVRYVSKN